MSLANIQFSRAFRTTEPDSDRSMVVHAAYRIVMRGLPVSEDGHHCSLRESRHREDRF